MSGWATTEAYRTRFIGRTSASWRVGPPLVALPFVSWALTGSSEAIRHWRIPEGVAYVTVGAAVLIHHLWAWRCPRCGAHQGRWIFEAKCAHCGLTARDGV